MCSHPRLLDERDFRKKEFTACTSAKSQAQAENSRKVPVWQHSGSRNAFAEAAHAGYQKSSGRGHRGRAYLGTHRFSLHSIALPSLLLSLESHIHTLPYACGPHKAPSFRFAFRCHYL
eukprot:4853940-Pleurochrysis_carterae.AAC.5